MALISIDLDTEGQPLDLNKLIEDFFAFLGAGLNRSVIPKMRQVTPVRSGDLQKSLKLITRPGGLTIEVLHYWPFVRGGKLAERHERILIEGINRLAGWAFNQALAKQTR